MRRRAKSEQIQIRVTTAEKRALERRARAEGRDLSSWMLGRLNPPRGEKFRKLVAALAPAGDRSYALTELGQSLMELGRSELVTATEALPPVDLDEVVGNQLAAMVELRFTRLGLRPPAWTSAIPPLRFPWFPTELLQEILGEP